MSPQVPTDTCPDGPTADSRPNRDRSRFGARVSRSSHNLARSDRRWVRFPIASSTRKTSRPVSGSWWSTTTSCASRWWRRCSKRASTEVRDDGHRGALDGGLSALTLAMEGDIRAARADRDVRIYPSRRKRAIEGRSRSASTRDDRER